jgi:hypothetical protein
MATNPSTRHQVAGVCTHDMFAFDHTTGGIPALWWLLTVLQHFYAFVVMREAQIERLMMTVDSSNDESWLLSALYIQYDHITVGFGVTINRKRGVLPLNGTFRASVTITITYELAK